MTQVSSDKSKIKVINATGSLQRERTAACAPSSTNITKVHYLFTYKSPAMGGALGAMHGLDNPFLFDSLDAEFTGNTPEVQSLATKIQDSCIAFTHTGDPSCESAGRWPEYGTNRMTMVFDINTRVEAAPFEAERHAWDSYDMSSTTFI